MPRQINVYGGMPDGRTRLVMATTSVSAFCKITRTRPDYASQTWNQREVTLCMDFPGVIFQSKNPYASLPIYGIWDESPIKETPCVD